MLIAVEDATSTSRRPAVQPWLVQDRDFAQLCALFPVSLVLCICIRIGRSCSACSLLNRKTKIKYIISVELLVDCARMSACVSVCVNVHTYVCVCVWRISCGQHNLQALHETRWALLNFTPQRTSLAQIVSQIHKTYAVVSGSICAPTYIRTCATSIATCRILWPHIKRIHNCIQRMW